MTTHDYIPLQLSPDSAHALRALAELRGESLSQTAEWAISLASARVTKDQWKELDKLMAAKERHSGR